jgi:hypothetical protein
LHARADHQEAAAQRTDSGEAVAFFSRSTRNLLEAERQTEVQHHVLLSIAGLTRVTGNAHYAGKRAQEELVERSPVPWSIVPATHFHDFAEMVTTWTERDGSATIAPLFVQPVAPADVADVLAEVAVGRPQRRCPDLAGPEPHDLLDLAPPDPCSSRHPDPTGTHLVGCFRSRHGWRCAAARARRAHHSHDVRRLARQRRDQPLVKSGGRGAAAQRSMRAPAGMAATTILNSSSQASNARPLASRASVSTRASFIRASAAPASAVPPATHEDQPPHASILTRSSRAHPCALVRAESETAYRR